MSRQRKHRANIGPVAVAAAALRTAIDDWGIAESEVESAIILAALGTTGLHDHERNVTLDAHPAPTIETAIAAIHARNTREGFYVEVDEDRIVERIRVVAASAGIDLPRPYTPTAGLAALAVSQARRAAEVVEAQNVRSAKRQADYQAFLDANQISHRDYALAALGAPGHEHIIQFDR